MGTDYDGGIYVIGLYTSPIDDDYDNDDDSATAKKRYFHHGQVPRIYVRKDWIETRVNETLKELNITDDTTDEESEKEEEEHEETMYDDYSNFRVNDPYHSYFEYSSNKGNTDVHRGITANIMGQHH